jgi:hypothetical protein
MNAAGLATDSIVIQDSLVPSGTFNNDKARKVTDIARFGQAFQQVRQSINGMKSYRSYPIMWS